MYIYTMKKAYTFDDVALIPKYSNVQSRTLPNLGTLLNKDITMKLPILAANMDTVIGESLANVLVLNGIIPIFHRFDTVEKISELVLKFKNNCFISCGLKDMDTTIKLFDLGAIGICIDISHGHSEMMIDFIKEFKAKRPNAKVIAGNVCTSR